MMRRTCGHASRRRRNRLCSMPAGYKTNHLGLGSCRYHGGSAWQVEEAWRMAQEIALELDVTPWDALLLEVRRSAARCAWLDERLNAAVRQDSTLIIDPDTRDEILLPAGLRPDLRVLLIESRNERRHMARVAKAAIDAGVAERLVRQIELEGRLVAEAVGAGLDALELLVTLTDEQRAAAVHAASERLLMIEKPTFEPT